MNVVPGASGQIGSTIVNALLRKKKPVRGVVRNPQKANELEKKGIEVAVADLFNLGSLKKAFSDVDTAFVFTPESLDANDVLADAQKILNNYKKAIQASEIKKIVGLSSMGAQYQSGTGNLQMSYMLEHSFEELPVKKLFIRPAYYYSNWMPSFNTVKEQGILPSFFPEDHAIPMVAPGDVAEFIAEKMISEEDQEGVYEVSGPQFYSPKDIANAFGEYLKRKVTVQVLPKPQWEETLQQLGFSESVKENFIQMTEAVISGKTIPEKTHNDYVNLKTGFLNYLRDTAAA